MSIYYSDVRKIEEKMLPKIKKIVKQESDDLRDHFDKNAFKMPNAIQNTPKDRQFHKHAGNSALRVNPLGDDVLQVYQFDFETQLATILTVQNNRITATETKKIADMPGKMIQAAQHAIKGSSRQHKTQASPKQ